MTGAVNGAVDGTVDGAVNGAVDVTASVVLFELGTEVYALPVEQVARVVRPTEPVRLPGAPPEVVGVVNLRGTIVTVVDPRVSLGVAVGSDEPGPGAPGAPGAPGELVARRERDSRVSPPERRRGAPVAEPEQLVARAGQSAPDPPPVRQLDRRARRVLVTDVGSTPTGLLVDAVRAVVEVSAGDVQAAPRSGADGRGVVGVVTVAERSVVLLDASVLVGPLAEPRSVPDVDGVLRWLAVEPEPEPDATAESV